MTDPTELSEVLMNNLMFAVQEGLKEGARWVWAAVQSVLLEWWPWILGISFILLIIAVLKASMGRWGMLGSLLYNFFYFGALLVIVLAMGPEVFVSNYFALFTTLILYPLCYLAVGWILDKTGLKRI